MSVYLVISYDVTDPEAYEAYPPGVIPLLQKHGAEILVAEFDATALEGEARDVHVVLRFPSEQAVLEWYHDPEYAPVKKIRLDASEHGSIVLAKPFVPPEG